MTCDARTTTGRRCRNGELYRTGRCWMHGARDRLNAAEAGDHPIAIGFERGAVRLLGAAEKLDDRAGGKS